MICPHCGAPDATIMDGRTLQCAQCHEEHFVQDPNKTCPMCESQLRTSASIHGGGFRTSRRSCRNTNCKYSIVVASFVVSTRDGTAASGPGHLNVAKAIREGKLRLVWDD